MKPEQKKPDTRKRRVWEFINSNMPELVPVLRNAPQGMVANVRVWRADGSEVT